jgi:DNA-binding LacI/PurR family transcriptional regulator
MLWFLFAKHAKNRADYREEDFQFHLASPHCNEDLPLPPSLLQEIDAGKVHGILMIGMLPEVYNWMDSKSVPSVAFAGPGKWMVETSSSKAATSAVDSLVEDGCRAIGLWTKDDTEADTELLAQFEAALRVHGLHYYPELVQRLTPRLTDSDLTYQEQGFGAIKRIFGVHADGELSCRVKPDGLIIQEDMMADGALAAMERMGLVPGKDLKIACETNLGSPILFGHQDQLTRLELDPEEIVLTMLRVLDDIMMGRLPTERHIQVSRTLRKPSNYGAERP